MSQLKVKELLAKLNYKLEKAPHILPGRVLVKYEEFEHSIDRIIAHLPEDIKEAERILKRCDDMVVDAQNRASRIIADAENEAARILSENEIMRAVQQEGQKIREQVILDCENMKRRAIEDADNVRLQAAEESLKIRQGAENYAEQVLSNIDTELSQLQQIVRNGQAYLEKMKEDSYQELTNSRMSSQKSSQLVDDIYAD